MNAVDFSLEGKVAVVTGGSRGLGRAIVLAYAEAGADVVIVSRKLDACEAVADAVVRATGRRAIPFAAHVGRWADVDALVAALDADVGTPHILVNNAGMAPLYPTLEDVTEDLFDKTIGVNLRGPFRLAALIGRRMVDAGRGSIINVSSVAAIRPKTTDLVYAAAKAGLDVLTAGFAKAYGPSVRVNTIMAGPFLTDIAHAWDMDVVGPRLRTYPLGRAGRPEEVTGAAIYLASDAASFTTGTVLRVDGGMSVA